MKTRITHIITFILLAVFTVYITPHEIVHGMYGHEDTQHCDVDHKGGPSFSQKHIHCDFLSSDLSTFLPGTKPERNSIVSEQFILCVQPFFTIRENFQFLSESRGPPLQFVLKRSA